MFKKLAALLFILTLWPSCAFALQNGNVLFFANPLNTKPLCPYPVDNGCSGAMVNLPGSYPTRHAAGRSFGDWLNQSTGINTDYTVNGPQRNLAAIDYDTGEFSPISSLSNPLVDPLPTNCVSISGNNGNPGVRCTTPFTFTGWNMGDGATHPCVFLSVNGSSGNYTIQDNLWVNNGNCTLSNGFNQFIDDQATGFAQGNVSYNTMDGKGTSGGIYETAWGSCPRTFGGVTCGVVNAFLLSGNTTASYNALLDFTQRPYGYQSVNLASGLTLSYNLMQGCCYRNGQAHGEYLIYSGNPGGTGWSLIGNTITDPTAHHIVGDGAFPLQFTTINPIPVLNVLDNFYIPGRAGGMDNSVKFSGTVTGNTFTLASSVNSVTNNPTDIGSGVVVICNAGSNQMSGTLVYDGSTGTTSAGIGGGGHGGVGSTWPLDLIQALITAGISDGSGGSGNILNVTTDQSMKLKIGDTVTIAAAARTITAMSPTVVGSITLTGTGDIGTYQVSGAAANAAAASVATNSFDVYAGGWAIPTAAGAINCATQTTTAFPFTRAMSDQSFSPPIGQATNTGNYMDMTVYGTGHAVWTQRDAANALLGTIAGTALSLQGPLGSTTVTAQGSGYTTATVAYSGGGGTGATGTAVIGTGINAGKILSITQTNGGSGYTSAPTATISGDGTGATATAVVRWFTGRTPAALDLVIGSGIAPNTTIVSGSNGSWVITPTQTIGTVTPFHTTQTWCSNLSVFGGNVDMGGIYTSATIPSTLNINTYNLESVPGNQCQ